MKVRNIGINNEFHNVAVSEDKKELQNKDLFQSRLRDFNRSNLSESLQMLASHISEQGELVCKRCDMGELKKYKELVSSFLKEAVAYSFEFEKESRMNAFGRHRVFANVKKINSSLSRLTEEILTNQKDPIEILKNVEDIKGLILDMLL